MLYGVQDIGRNMMGLSSHPEKLRKSEFWAVDDISFEVKRGETLGIIGLNGAGKTTLLKMLNGIFWPDTGKITLKGRVGGLIEVGAGFHPLLSGRENIYINGSILGLKKKEIDDKFGSIIEFAGLGEFIDSPIKFYSSGMYVRLGFAVAVHLDPDILLVDEVLAVGDIAFRVKCLEKIKEFKQRGVAIVFVSHSLEMVQDLCTRGLFLSQGKISCLGDVVSCIDQYIASNKENLCSVEERRWGNRQGEIENVIITNADGEEAIFFRGGDSINVRVKYRLGDDINNPVMGISVIDARNNKVYGINTLQYGNDKYWRDNGEIMFHFPSFDLSEGIYFITVALHDRIPHVIYDWRDKVKSVEIASLKKFGGKFDLGCKIIHSTK